MTDLSVDAASSLDEFLLPQPHCTVDPLLDAIAAQAKQADSSRSVDPQLIAALKASDVLRLAASENLGGLEASILQIGRELEAVSARCTSTAWTLWNHLAVFHLYVGSLGPDHQDLLRGIVDRGEWVCFTAARNYSIKCRLIRVGAT